jgi:elongation factor Ts
LLLTVLIESTEGAAIAVVNAEKTAGVVTLNCETDFVGE